MDKNTLARMMLLWGEKKEELDRIEKEITEAILERQATQTVGSIRATYSQGRKTYDYMTAAAGWSGSFRQLEEVTEKHSKLVIDFKKVCEELEVTDIPFKQGLPSVRLTLEDED